MASLAPPMAPDILAQQTPQGAQSAFAAQGLGRPQPGMDAIRQAIAQVQKLENDSDELYMMLGMIHPGLRGHMAAIVAAGGAIKQSLAQLAQQSGVAQGSPVTGPTPTGIPMAGPPNPQGM